MGPERREDGVEFFDGFRRKFGQLARAFDQGVGTHDSGTAGVSDDGQPISLRRLLPGQQLCTVEHVFDTEDALNAGSLECGLVDSIYPGHGTGVRGSRLSRLGKSPSFKGHNGLRSRKARAADTEFAGFGNRLDIEDDRLGVSLRTHIVDQIPHIHIQHVAHRHEIGKANALIDGPIEDRGTQGAPTAR